MDEALPRWSVREPLAILLLRNVPFWRRSRTRRVARIAVFVCYLYVGVLLTLMALEDRLLFPGATFPRRWELQSEQHRIRELTLTSADGERIHAWFTAPKEWSPRQGAILYSHGNNGNLTSISWRAIQWRDPFGRAVLIYDYPGFGKSSGRPSEAGCYAAGESALTWLVEEQQVPAREIILVGGSLGGAIATELATRHEVRMLVLHGTFTSFPDMAQARLPIFPGRYLVRNCLDNESKIGHVRCPVFITHGTADSSVPFSQGERLYAVAREPKRFLRIEGGKHAPPSKDLFFDQLRSFLVDTSP